MTASETVSPNELIAQIKYVIRLQNHWSSFCHFYLFFTISPLIVQLSDKLGP